MVPARRWTVVVALAVLAAACAQFLARHAARRRSAAAGDSAAAERAVLDADLAFYARRTELDPRGAADRLQLAALYARRAHATTSADDWRRAEHLARRSLAIRTGHNARAFGVLASALMAQHRFAEADSAARELADAEPWVPGHRALRAEILMELGRYDAARAGFDSLRMRGADLSVAPRYARWLEVTGKVETARSWLHAALEEARRQRHFSHDQLAWYYWRLADFELRQERWGVARDVLVDGLALAPDDRRLLLAAARLAAARHRWRTAVRLGEEALAGAYDLEPLVVLAQAYRASGDTARATDALRALEAALAAGAGPLHRPWGLALLDAGRASDLVYRKAREDLAARPDIYGYDLVAWAALALGRPAEARAAMDTALALGTRDPLLARHGAAIDSALGR